MTDDRLQMTIQFNNQLNKKEELGNLANWLRAYGRKEEEESGETRDVRRETSDKRRQMTDDR
jgi:hypothetical protein